MVKMKKHILYIALGLLALIAIITTVLAIGGVVTLPVIGQPAIQQPAVSDSQPHGPTAAEVEALIDALPQPVTNADSIKVLIARLAYRELSTSQQAQVHNLSLLEAAEQILAELGRKSSESGLTVIGVDSRVTFTGEGAAHPFHLVSEDGSGIYGWVDENAVHLG